MIVHITKEGVEYQVFAHQIEQRRASVQDYSTGKLVNKPDDFLYIEILSNELYGNENLFSVSENVVLDTRDGNGSIIARIIKFTGNMIAFYGYRHKLLECPFCGCAVDVRDICSYLSIQAVDSHGQSCPLRFERNSISVSRHDLVPELVRDWNTRVVKKENGND